MIIHTTNKILFIKFILTIFFSLFAKIAKNNPPKNYPHP